MDAYITYRYAELNNFTRPSEVSGISGRGWFIAGALICYLLSVYLFMVAWAMRSYIKHSAFITSVLCLPLLNLVILSISEVSGTLVTLKLYHIVVTAEFLTFAICCQILLTSLYSVFFHDPPSNCTFAYMSVPIFSLCLSVGLYYVKNFMALRILTVAVSALPLACAILTFVLSLVLIFMSALGPHRDEVLTPAVLVFFTMLFTIYANYVNLLSTVKSLFGPFADAGINFFIMDHPKTPLMAEIFHPLIPAVLSVILFASFDQFRHPIHFGREVIVGAFHSQLMVLFSGKIWRNRRGSTTEVERLDVVEEV